MSAAPAEVGPAAAARQAVELLRQMLRIRRFEERCAELYQAEEIRGFLHLYIGEEAVAAGVLAALGPEDAVLATYREHGHALARGVPMAAVMAEMLGRATGCSGGRGGSMHLFDAERRFFGGNAIVAGHLPLATGLGLADRMSGRAGVTVCFFGEGATAEGEFQESLNLAALWRLPVLFVCENNGFAMGTAIERAEARTNLVAKAEALGVPGVSVDGMDVLAVEAAAREAVQATRSGEARFLEARTYRFRGHSSFDAQLYRSKEEVRAWEQRDPIRSLRARLEADGPLATGEFERLDEQVLAEVEASVAFARSSPIEGVERLCEGLVGPRPVPAAADSHPPGPTVRTSYREAVRAALAEAIESDPRVFLVGEDVGRYGGCYAVSKGLYDRFGPERIRDAPLSESGFVGAGIGAAMAGMRPIVEVMTVNFSLLALDQIVNNAATLRHMSGGQVTAPVVIRMATGAGRQLAAQHSHSLDGWYAHVPGLRVLAPATLEDARGMLRAALVEPDPVVILEHVMLYNVEGDLPERPVPVDLDRAAVKRGGRDLTLVAWSACLPKALAAAEQLAAEWIDAEVIDLRVLRPLDTETLLASVRRTRRALVVEEAWRTGGLGAEIAARLAEEAFWDLDAPVGRLGAVEVPVPYPKHLEAAALPQVEGIVAAARALCHRARP